MKRILSLLCLLLLLTASLGFSQVSNSGSNEAVAGEDETTVFIPNAFTPNDDGVNDVYYIPNSNFTQFEFSVFDRWGNRVFHTTQSEFRWTGDSKGRKVPTGIYVFVLSATDAKGNSVKRSGTITVVR